MDAIHPFERAGLGKAPFRYVGIEDQEIQYGERLIGVIKGCAVTTKPGGTCKYCNAYILNMFVIESADGQRFHVGCDCLKKVDAKLVKICNEDIKKLKRSREMSRIAAAKKNMPDAEESLRGLPHPRRAGDTLWDYADWLFAHAGHAGCLRAARMVEDALTQRGDDGGLREPSR